MVLAGGTGGAKLAAGMQAILPPGALTVIANPGDDLDLWGLRICPDLDSVIYHLAGIFDAERGFGVAGDTFAAHAMMGRLGEPDWFWLGDRDLGVHLLRTRLLGQGMRPSQVALELGRRLGVPSRVVPATDDPVRTHFLTDAGRLSFQEYFVRHRLEPRLRSIEFDGLEKARPSPEAREALVAADLVVIGPSNPLISIEPILNVLGPPGRQEVTVAVTPIVGGRALKGPTVEMMAAVGLDPTPVGVARRYQKWARWYVLDALDQGDAGRIEALGLQVVVADTVMAGIEGAKRLALRLVGMG